MQKTTTALLSDWPLITLALLLIVFTGLNSYFQWTKATDRFLYDQGISLQAMPVSDNIVIIEIDEQSLSFIGNWPWDRSYHAELIDILTDAGANFVAYNLAFIKSKLPLNTGDYMLAEAIKRNKHVILPIYFDQILKSGPVEEVLPNDIFSSVAVMGHVNVYLDDDGVYRRVRLTDNYNNNHWPHFSLAAASISKPDRFPEEHQGNFSYMRFVDQKRNFQRYSFVDVITGEIKSTEFYKRNVFVGVTATSLGDPLLTPVSNDGKQMPAVDINANIFQMLISGQSVTELPLIIGYGLNTLFILLIVFLIPRLSIARQVIFISMMMSLVLLFSWFLLMNNFWFQSAGLQIALFLTPLVWNALRLSRLFQYFRVEGMRLEQQHREEVFHFPDQLVIHSPKELENVLALMGIEEFSLEKKRQQAWSRITDKGVLEHNFPVNIGQDTWSLRIYFNEYRETEKRLVYLLERLLEPSPDKKDDGVSFFQNKSGSDIFSRQLMIIRNTQKIITSSQHLFESSIQELSSGVVVADLNGRILFRNQALKQLLGSDGGNLFQILEVCTINEGKAWRTYLRQALLTPDSITVEARSGLYDVSVSIHCLEDQSTRSPLLVVNVSDITQVKEAQRSRNEMLDFISHDMRSPMASLQALVDQFRHSASSLSVDELIKKVDFHSQRGLNFAEEFLSLAKVESEDNIQQYEVDLYSVSQNAIDTLYEQAQQKKINLHLDVCDDSWVMANGDMLERVFLNLISNAIKYSPINSSVYVSVNITDDTDYLHISVRDEGPGIPDNLLPDLFKPFRRGTTEIEKQSKGLGLGLRFVDVALKRHQSRIQVSSSTQGTIFYFELPRLQLDSV